MSGPDFMAEGNSTIIGRMKEKPLSKTNRYLKDNTSADALMVRSIASSTAIETGEPISKIEDKLTQLRASSYRVTLA
jgi:hypothetical protein